MTFHIKDVPDNHPIWWATSQAVSTVVLLNCPWLVQHATLENEDEFVHGLAAASDFLYGLSYLGRLRGAKGEIKTVNYISGVTDVIANDTEVRNLFHKCVNEYRYSSWSDNDDAYYEDVRLNKLCVQQVYATLMNLGYVSYYERQEQVVTTKQVKV